MTCQQYMSRVRSDSRPSIPQIGECTLMISELECDKYPQSDAHAAAIFELEWAEHHAIHSSIRRLPKGSISFHCKRLNRANYLRNVKSTLRIGPNALRNVGATLRSRFSPLRNVDTTLRNIIVGCVIDGPCCVRPAPTRVFIPLACAGRPRAEQEFKRGSVARSACRPTRPSWRHTIATRLNPTLEMDRGSRLTSARPTRRQQAMHDRCS